MTRSHATRRRRWLIGGLVGVLAVVVIGMLVATFFARDTTTPILLDDVVEDFRASATTADVTPTDPSPAAPSSTAAPDTTVTPTTMTPPSTTTPAQALPSPGVYRYRTTGGERIDALGGTGHEYPEETTITVTERGCGVHLRWDALRERREEWTLCATPAGVELQAESIQFHEFFGISEAETLTCDRTVVLVPVAEPPPDPVELDCMLADDPWFPTWEVLEATTRTVDGQAIAVRHVRMTIVDEDEYWEHNTADWYLALDGLPVEVVVDKSSRSPTFVGGVVYDEDYRLELLSLSPLR